ncbi:MAG: ABC transporter ATP-binding protein [Anaerolineae bacterium]|nr:ABC transporter ATP-binding protein [Anaerolineae bacterium]
MTNLLVTEDIVLVENVYKQYQMFKGVRMRHAVQEALKFMREQSKRKANPEQRFVLKDVSFRMKQGETLGLIGHNGSGKTTLMRLLAGVSLPTQGRIRVVGRVQPLLSLGAGFHNELTGRQNIYLNCTLMGLDISQTKDRIEQIIAFADIGDYIDVPVKRYSSGMLSRVGFAAAVHMNAEIVLIDEVMAVGDYSFNVKSTAAIREYIKHGTVVLVSHDVNTMERICERVIWLDHGEVRADGQATQVLHDYTQSQQRKVVAASPIVPPPAEATVQPTAPTADRVMVNRDRFDLDVTIQKVSVLNREGEDKNEFAFDDVLLIRAEIEFAMPKADVRITVGIVDIDTKAVITLCDNQLLKSSGSLHGRVEVEARFPNLKLRPRNYGVRVGIADLNALKPLDVWTDVSPRFYFTGERHIPEQHLFQPQIDLIFTPGVSMKYINSNAPQDTAPPVAALETSPKA